MIAGRGMPIRQISRTSDIRPLHKDGNVCHSQLDDNAVGIHLDAQHSNARSIPTTATVEGKRLAPYADLRGGPSSIGHRLTALKQVSHVQKSCVSCRPHHSMWQISGTISNNTPTVPCFTNIHLASQTRSASYILLDPVEEIHSSTLHEPNLHPLGTLLPTQRMDHRSNTPLEMVVTQIGLRSANSAPQRQSVAPCFSCTLPI